MLLVSVIIPNYNHARYLHKRILSVLDQTYQDFEIIILDDCSTDNSKEIIEQYRGNSKVSHIVYNDINSGSPFKQWHKGFELAKGELIWIAESDDWCAVNFLEVVASEFEKHKDIVISYTESNLYIEAEDKIISNHWGKWLDQEKWENDYVIDGKDEIATILVYLCSILNASAVVFKKATLSQINIESIAGFRYTGDYMLWSQLAKSGKISFKSSPLNFFRYHNKSTRVNKPLHLEILSFKEIFEVINFNKHITDQLKYQLNFSNYEWIFKSWIKKSKGLRQELLLLKFMPSYLKSSYFNYLIKYYLMKAKRKVSKIS